MESSKRAYSEKLVKCIWGERDQTSVRYNSYSRKPVLLQPVQRCEPITRQWESIYNSDFWYRCDPSWTGHAYNEPSSFEKAAHPGSVKEKRLWASAQSGNGVISRRRKCNKPSPMGIPGLESATCMDNIRIQDPKPIVGTHPLCLIPKLRDIRYLSQHRMPYVDPDILKDHRKEYRLEPPSALPRLTPKIVYNLMVSQKPVSKHK